MTRRSVGLFALVCFIATIFLANWAVDRWGVVPVGFGLEAPAGVWFVGAAFLFRDLVDRLLGKAAVVLAIVAGAALSWWIGDAASIPGGYVSIAVASGIAFLASETLDLGVFTALERRFTTAVVASNIAATLLDSWLFLTLAFGSLSFFWGQVVGKSWITLAALPLVLASRRVLRPA